MDGRGQRARSIGCHGIGRGGMMSLMTCRSFCLIATLSLLFMAAGSALAADAITIDKQAVSVETINFDPGDPPSDMPSLSAGEAAVARSSFGVASRLEVEVPGEAEEGARAWSLKITAIRVELALNVTIWLPNKAAAHLVAHEQGHRRISEIFYKDGEKIMRSLAERYIGRTMRVEGRTVQAANEAAMNKVINELNGAYMGATQIPGARVNEIFDKITSHGRKGGMSVDAGIGKAFEQYREEEAKKKKKK